MVAMASWQCPGVKWGNEHRRGEIIGKECIFYHLLERCKIEWNRRKGIFSFAWYTKEKENIMCSNYNYAL